MSHALATVLHRGRKAASNIMSACLASSREALRETGRAKFRSSSRERTSVGNATAEHRDIQVGRTLAGAGVKLKTWSVTASA